MEWEREYLCEPFKLTPEEKRMQELAAEYHQKTEAYDRSICSGKIINNSILPLNIIERSLINKHALNLFDSMLKELLTMGITEKQFRSAICEVNRRK